MRRSTLAICALLTVATYGCDSARDKLKLAWDKVRGKSTTTATAPTPPAQAPDTAAARRAAAQRALEAQRPTTPAPARPQGAAPIARDVPYVSQDTGTIAPGMSEREVYALWGAPAALRRAGEYTYLFFNNGCEYTCGTMDVVTLKDGAVVDAIVRWDGHIYAGESSSPPGNMPRANPAGDTLRVPPL